MFSKIHKTSWNYKNHHQKHACEIKGSLEKLQFLTEKCLQRWTFKTGWNFDIFSMFSKFHETYRSYWNHHQKHACEIWGSLEKLQSLKKNAYSAGPSKQDEILTFSQCSPNFMKLTEVIGITTRNMHVKFEAVWRRYNFWRKNAYSAGPSKQDEILTFSQCSPKFIKLTEVIGITTRNMHVKFEAVRRSYNFWRKNAYSAGPSKRDEILTFSQCSPNFMKLTEVIGITTRNMHVKFEAVWRSYNFWRKMPTVPDLQNRMKFWHFLNVLQISWNLQKLLQSPPETCMWNLRQFGEVTIFDGKMPTAPNLKNRMKFRYFINVLQNSWNLQKLLESPPETCMWNLRQLGEVTIFDGKMPTAPDLKNRIKFRHFLNVLQNSWNLQNLLESPPDTCMWNLRQFGEVTIFDRKCRQCQTLETGWNFDFFSMFSKIHETYRIYWNHHQKHACEIWGSLEKLQFLMENADLQRSSFIGKCMWNLRQFGEVTIFDGKCRQQRIFKTGWNFDIF